MLFGSRGMTASGQKATIDEWDISYFSSLGLSARTLLKKRSMVDSNLSFFLIK
jgi:hypothetical protein